MTRRLADDWLAAHGHRVLVAETFCDPQRFAGTMYRAAGWQGLGKTKGYARMNGQYTDPHGQPKEILVTQLRSAMPAGSCRTRSHCPASRR